MGKRLMAAVAIIACVFIALPGCSLLRSAPAWENAPSVNDKISAGSDVSLEPVKYAPVVLEGSKSVKFDFNCKLTGEEIPGYTRTFVIISNSGDMQVTSTVSYNFTDWEKGKKKVPVQYSLSNAPTANQSYSGEGFVYFYLADADGKCISNIVKWAVTFK